MKIAKKVLAAAMAVAMIFALSAMAFAASSPKLVLEASEVDDEGYIIVTLYAVDSIGLLSAGVDVKYDPTVLEFDFAKEGKDAAQVNKTKNNSFSSEYNPADAGTIDFGFYFKTSLTDAATLAADAQKGETIDVNSDKFAVAAFYFLVKNADAANTELEVVVTSSSGVTPAGSKLTVVLKEEEEVPAEEIEEPEEPEAPVVEPGSEDANGEEGNKNTGDNMALAAAAGVVVLAGAAFIVSKKRK